MGGPRILCAFNGRPLNAATAIIPKRKTARLEKLSYCNRGNGPDLLACLKSRNRGKSKARRCRQILP